MACEPDVALLMIASGYLIFLQQKMPPERLSKVANGVVIMCNTSPTEHWPIQCRIRLFLLFNVTSISNCMALVNMHFKNQNFITLTDNPNF